MIGHYVPRPDIVSAAVAALTAPQLGHVVDLVAWVDGAAGRETNGRPKAVRVACETGECVLSQQYLAGKLISGQHPLHSQDPLAFATNVHEAADPSPPRDRNSYPLAWERLASFFTDVRSPDIAVVHTGGHFFPEQGGHVGEHGSLSVIQSRAPLLLSGPGVVHRGALDDYARLVDVMPTIAWTMGVPRESLARLDGVIRDDLVGPGAKHVLGLLWDGGHPGSLVQAAREGLLPNVARLLERGCWLQGGAVAEFPSLTLVNHTSILTGVGPGRHGVVGNVFYDRETGKRVVPNDPATWHRTSDLYREGVTTLFEAVKDANREIRTASVNEMTERGADASTFALVRAALADGRAADPGEAGSAAALGFVSAIAAVLPDPRLSPYVTLARCDDEHYAFYSAIDLLGLATMQGLLSPEALAPEGAPTLTWWSQYATDAAHHAGGPRSAIARDAFIDCDRRLGVVLDQLESIGVLGQTLVVLTADHGFERSDQSCRGDWGPALRAALEPMGVVFRDEGPGFIYLDVAP